MSSTTATHHRAEVRQTKRPKCRVSESFWAARDVALVMLCCTVAGLALGALLVMSLS